MLNKLLSISWKNTSLIFKKTVSIFFTLFFIYFIYYFCLVIYYLNNNSKFLKRSKKEVLTLISGGSYSGKKLLLTFLKEKLWIKGNKEFEVCSNSLNYFNFFDSKCSYNIDKNEWKKNYFLFDNKKSNKKLELLFVNEIEDCPLNLKSEIFIDEKKNLISEIYSSNYFKRRIWIAFSKRDGFLWNNLLSRSNSVVYCREVIEKRFLYLKIFRFYIIKISVTDPTRINKIEKYSLIVWARTFSNYKKTWSKELFEKWLLKKKE